MQDRKPLNDKGLRHGHWLVFYAPSSDNIWYEAYFVNGVECGYEMNTIPFSKREKYINTMQDKKPRDEQGEPNGNWVVYYPKSNVLWYTANFVNGDLRGHFEHNVVKTEKVYYAK
jgi:hypothetical protein